MTIRTFSDAQLKSIMHHSAEYEAMTFELAKALLAERQAARDGTSCIPKWQEEQERVDPEHCFAEYKFMQDEIDALRAALQSVAQPVMVIT